jgi:hypothetical protein
VEKLTTPKKADMARSKLTAEDLKRLFRDVSNVQRFIQKYEAQYELLNESDLRVLKMTAEGFSISGIAEQLNQPQEKIAACDKQIRRCLPIRSQLDYVKFALAFGLIPF